MRIQKLMALHRLLDKAGGETGSDSGGTGSGQGGEAAGATGTATGGDGGTDEKGGSGEQGTATGGEASGKEGQASKVSDTEAALLKDAMKHKSRAKELEAQLTAMREQLTQFDGIDPVKVRELLKAQQEKELRDAEARGEYDRVLKQMGDRHREETSALNAQLEQLRGSAQALQGQIGELTVGNAFASSRFVAEDLTLTPAKARVIYGNHFEFKDGKVVGFDKPAGASERTVLVNAEGDALSFDEALRHLVNADPDREQLIRAKSRSGAGSSTVQKGAKDAVAKSTERAAAKLSPAEKIAAGLKSIARG